MNSFFLALGLTLPMSVIVSAQTSAPIRNWKSNDGKAIQASFVSLQGDQVEIKMANGSLFKVPLNRFSAEDQQYAQAQAYKSVSTDAPNSSALPAASKTWPRMVALESKPEIVVVKESPETKEYIYKSPHYEFQCDSKLGANVVREFGRLFEATWLLNCLLPLDLKPEPEKLRTSYLARLFTGKSDYMAAGGVEGSGGIYMSGKKALMVPLSSLGVKMAGSRVILEGGNDDDNATLIHEITHQMMNRWLGLLSTWMIEGAAEYAEIPEYDGSGKFNFIGIERRLKKYAERMNGWQGSGKEFKMLDLEELMGLDGARWANALVTGQATQNYGSAGMLTYFFYHMDGEGDGANIIAFYQAVKMAKTKDELKAATLKHLMRERSYAQLADDVKKGFRKEGIDILFQPPGKNAAASASQE